MAEALNSLDNPKDIADLPYGCEHYRRKVLLVAPCCNKVYVCRFCHNLNEDHEIDRNKIKEVVCAVCTFRQPVNKVCTKCEITFGKYACLKCNLFDDINKKQYHCYKCGFCRSGGRENYFHCEKCNLCLDVHVKFTHKCVENCSKNDCPVCLDDIHTSRLPCRVPPCGHLLHVPCFDSLIKAKLYYCPTCRKSLGNMTQYWDMLDRKIEQIKMSKELIKKVNIYCRDCYTKSNVNFHVVGLKCLVCGSYNTYQTDDDPNTRTIGAEIVEEQLLNTEDNFLLQNQTPIQREANQRGGNA